MNDDDAVTAALQDLSDIFSVPFDDVLKLLIDFRIQRWGAEVGNTGYSTRKPGVKDEDVRKIFAPHKNVLFAGEHTSTKYSATMHGAMLSAATAASMAIERILKK